MSGCCDSNMHEHHKGGECSCGCGCGCGSKHHLHHDSEGHCHCVEKFLELADEAWKELLVEKIKEKILTKKGEHLEKLAEIISTANGERWKHKIGAKTNVNEFKDKLKEFLSACE